MIKTNLFGKLWTMVIWKEASEIVFKVSKRIRENHESSWGQLYWITSEINKFKGQKAVKLTQSNIQQMKT